MNKSWLWWIAAPVVFALTINPLTGPWKLVMAVLALLGAIVNGMGEKTTERKLAGITIFGLFLVGATNWFFSPFFFVLYLLSMGLTFVMGPLAGLGFVISLVAMFVFNVGQVDVAYDSLVLLSLLVTFPISLYLRKEYLKLQEAQKKILVLEKEGRIGRNDTVARMLANVVTNFSAEMRQPLVNVKNYSHVLGTRKLPVAKAKEYLQKIYQSSQVALKELDNFDEDVTGMKITKNS